MMNREYLIAIIALIVAGVWAVVALASLLIEDYTGLTIVTPIMGIVSAFLFGLKKNGKDNA